VIDSHCHIDFDEFAQHLPEVLQRAVAVGVDRLIIPAVHPDTWPRVIAHVDACRQWGVKAYYAIGLHPWWADKYPLDQLPTVLNEAIPGAVAVGECGLDALRDIPMEWQVAVLQCHIEAANHFNLPLILHCVKAHDTLIKVLKATPLKAGGVVHGFAGSLEIATQYLGLGLKIGVGGMVTRPHASRAQRAFSELPLSAMILETDAPAMPLWNDQLLQLESTNEPANVARIAHALAELRGVNIDDIVSTCQRNTEALFAQMR